VSRYIFTFFIVPFLVSPPHITSFLVSSSSVFLFFTLPPPPSQVFKKNNLALPACQAISMLFFGADRLYGDQLFPAILSPPDRNLLEKHWLE
jgi:hypothetical protein